MGEVESERLDKLERLIGQLGESVQRLTQGHGDERTVQRQASRIEDEFSKEELDAIREEREYRRLVARLERWETEKAKREPEPKDEDSGDDEEAGGDDGEEEEEEEAPPRSKRTPPARRRPPARHKPDEDEDEQEPQPESLGGWLRQLAGGGS